MGEARLDKANELRRRAEAQIASAGWLSARELLEDALAIYREEGEGAGESACLRGLGDVALKLEESDTAERLYAEALIGARAAKDRLHEAECLYRQADLCRARSRYPDAQQLFEAAAQVYRELGHRRGEAQCLGLLGETRRVAGGAIAEVLELYQRSQRLQLETGDLRGAAITLGFIANLLKDPDPKRAAEAYVQAARIYEGLGLAHRAEPFLAAARRLDPVNTPPPSPRAPGPWDTDD